MAARIPNLTRGIDVFSLPLSTKEGFVLSRVDGITSVEDISLMVGIRLSELLSMLDRLADLGAVQLSWRPQKPPAAPQPKVAPPAAATSGAHAPRHGGHGGPAAVARALVEPETPLYSESELEAKADISLDLKRRILTGYYGLEGKDYYQLLGVARSADKKEIKAAYFALSKLFHTDSQFGKDLGSFKSKMETVFKRLTEAYEVLGRNSRRKEYDEYLASTATTSAVQQQFDQVQHDVVAIEAQAAAVAAAQEYDFSPGWPREGEAGDWPRESEVRTPAVGRDSRLGQQPVEAHDRRSEPQATVAVDKPHTVVPPPSAEARREAAVVLRPPTSREDRKAQARERLRRNLPGAVAPMHSQSPAAPAAADRGAMSATVDRGPAASAPRAAARPGGVRSDSAITGLRQDLRRSGQSAGADPVMAQLRKAKDAEQAGDMLGAASALQAALSLAPNHKDLQAEYARVSKAVTRSLADNYEKQARYEEKQNKWAAAAISWERVADGRPEDAKAARATAEALLKAGGDLHKAQRYAQRAVAAAPSDIDNVVVLARVLLAAGLRLNARRELEKAVKLDPRNEIIKNLLREAR